MNLEDGTKRALMQELKHTLQVVTAGDPRVGTVQRVLSTTAVYTWSFVLFFRNNFTVNLR